VEVRTGVSLAAVVAVATFAAGVVVGWRTDPDGPATASTPTTDGSSPTSAPEPAEKLSRAERLLAEYGCWTDETEGRPVPTHAVVSLPGERAALVDAGTGYAIWLEGAPGRLYGFCP
jgi:hypothetical protein